MKLLRILPLAFLIAVGASACGKAKEKSAGEKIVEEWEAMATAVCACPKDDMACMEKAMAGDDAVEAKMEKEFPDKSKVPADLTKRMNASEEKAKKCAMGEGPPPTEGSGSGTGTGSGISQEDQLLLDLGMVQGKVCACADKACVDKELEAASAFDDRFKALYGDESKVPAAVKASVDAIQKGVEECASKIGAGQAPTPPPVAGGTAEAEKVIVEFQALKDEICKCADMACAEAAMEKGEALEDKLKAALGDGDTPASIDEAMEKIEDEAEKCIEKLAP